MSSPGNPGGTARLRQKGTHAGLRHRQSTVRPPDASGERRAQSRARHRVLRAQRGDHPPGRLLGLAACRDQGIRGGPGRQHGPDRAWAERQLRLPRPRARGRGRRFRGGRGDALPSHPAPHHQRPDPPQRRLRGVLLCGRIPQARRLRTATEGGGHGQRAARAGARRTVSCRGTRRWRDQHRAGWPLHEGQRHQRPLRARWSAHRRRDRDEPVESGRSAPASARGPGAGSLPLRRRLGRPRRLRVRGAAVDDEARQAAPRDPLER